MAKKIKTINVANGDDTFESYEIGTDGIVSNTNTIDKFETVSAEEFEELEAAGSLTPNTVYAIEDNSNFFAAAHQIPVGTGLDYFGSKDNVPDGWVLADGSAISRTEYNDLFLIIGTTYGAGDGSTTFNVPDKRTKVSVMLNENDTTKKFNTLGSKGGSATHTLTIDEMPAHSHTIRTVGNVKNANSITFTDDANAIGAVDGTTEEVGGGKAFDNMPPYIVCNYIIKAKV